MGIISKCFLHSLINSNIGTSCQSFLYCKLTISPSISPQRETGKNEEILLLPPEYALNKNTHNYEGLVEELQRQKVTVIKEINAILRLTDFGKLKGRIWKILYDINNSPQMKARIVMPGKYILKLLQN